MLFQKEQEHKVLKSTGQKPKKRKREKKGLEGILAKQNKGVAERSKRDADVAAQGAATVENAQKKLAEKAELYQKMICMSSCAFYLGLANFQLPAGDVPKEISDEAKKKGKKKAKFLVDFEKKVWDNELNTDPSTTELYSAVC